MKKKQIQWMYLILIVFTASCSVTEKISVWQDKPITTDGVPMEYAIPLNHFDTDTKLQYTFSNDLDNLYFCIRATEEEAQAKILRAGVQILIDTTGKEKEFVSIQYPLPHNRNQESPRNGQKPETKPRSNDSIGVNEFEGIKKSEFDLDEMKLDGFKESTNGLAPVNSHGIMFAIKIDQNKNLTFEGKIPFKTFYKNKLSSADFAKQFVILVKLNAMITPQLSKDVKKPQANGEGNRPSGGNKDGGRSGGNTRQGGGGRSHGNNMQNQDKSEMPENDEAVRSNTYPFEKVNTIKIKYKLSIPK